MVVNYQLGKIYKIVCNETGLIYVGSTCEPTLTKRLTKHRDNYKKWLNGKYPYVTSFKVLEKGNYNIILIEDYPCDRREQLLAKERKYIEEIECVNKCIPMRTKKEWANTNIDKIKERDKKWREANTEKIKEYREVNAEKIKEYRELNAEKMKEYLKEYRELNAEKIKEYREVNAEKIKEYQKKYREMKKLEQKDKIC
jgi:hypothetical protein